MFAQRTTRVVICLSVALVWALVAGPSALAWAWPVDGAVLSGFSVSADTYAAGQHRGIDIALGASSAIRAPVSGEVTFAGRVPTNGLTVTIATGDYKVSLTHLGALRVRRGASVVEGDVVAEPGPSGEAEHDLPYVHLGIRVGASESYVDPLELLPPRSAPSPPPAPEAPPAPLPQPAPAPPAAASPPLRCLRPLPTAPPAEPVTAPQPPTAATAPGPVAAPRTSSGGLQIGASEPIKGATEHGTAERGAPSVAHPPDAAQDSRRAPADRSRGRRAVVEKAVAVEAEQRSMRERGALARDGRTWTPRRRRSAAVGARRRSMT